MENKKSKTIQMIGEIPIDFGKVCLNKKKEKICGDYYTIITEPGLLYWCFQMVWEVE